MIFMLQDNHLFDFQLSIHIIVFTKKIKITKTL